MGKTERKRQKERGRGKYRGRDTEHIKDRGEKTERPLWVGGIITYVG
jgi:hypothetical protein